MQELEKRINDLEVKFSFQDDLINELNLIVAKQEVKISEMVEYLKHLSESSEPGSTLDNEKPPHY